MSERDWVHRIAFDAVTVEIEQCMNDLLDRAEFAEEIARRQILERLVAALMRQSNSSIGAEVLRILCELDDLRAVA